MSAPAPRRLRIQPGEVIDRTKPVRFGWDRTPMTGFAGDSIVSAVMANGVRVLSKGSALSKARGFSTVDAGDPRCLVRVDGEQNVRAGHRRIAEGMEVEPQSGWPIETGSEPGARMSRFSPAPILPVYRRLRERVGGASFAAHQLPPAHYGRRSIHVDVLVIGTGPAGMSAAVAASLAGASVLLVDERHFLGSHLRWGNEVDRALLSELVEAVEAADGIDVLLGASVVGDFDDGWCAVSQPNADGFDEYLTLVRAGAVVETSDVATAPGTFEGADKTGVMTAEAVRMLVNLYAVAPGDRAVILGGTSEADAANVDLMNVGIDVVQFVDPQLGQTISAVRGSKGSLKVTMSDGSTVDADLVVVGERWARRPDRVGASVHRTGRGVVGVPQREMSEHEALVAHGVATGRLAARRAVANNYRIRELTPRALCSGGLEGDWPADNRSATDSIVLDSIGPTPGVPPSLGALATEVERPSQQSAIQTWHVRNGAVHTTASGWTRTEHYGNPQDEVRRARSGVGVHDITSLAVFVLNGTHSRRILEALSDTWAQLEPTQLRQGAFEVSGGRLTHGFAGCLSGDSFLLTAGVEHSDELLQRMVGWIADQPTHVDASVDLMTAAYTGVRIAGNQGTELLSRLSDGIVRVVPGGHLDRVWLAGVADCILLRLDGRADPIYELHVPSGHGLHVWEQIFELASDLEVVPIGYQADRIIRLEAGHLAMAQTVNPPWTPDPTKVVSLVTADPAIVPIESCRVVAGEGASTVGRVLAAEFSPTFERSMCLAEVGRRASIPGTALSIVNPDGERIAVTVASSADFDDVVNSRA